MIKEVITDRSLLCNRSKEVNILTDEDLENDIKDLTDTLNSLDDDVLYLTASQIGLDKRILAIRFRDSAIKVMINPAIQKRDKLILFREKDPLSHEEYFVPRFAELHVVYQDPEDPGYLPKAMKLNEGASVVMGQALDFLNGLFPEDYGLIILPAFDEASEEEKSELLAAYANSIKEGYATLDEELSNDEETKQKWGAAKFITALAKGDVEPAPEELSNRKKRRLKRWLKRLGIKKK